MDLELIFINTIDIDYDDQPKNEGDLKVLLIGMWNPSFLGEYAKELFEYIKSIEADDAYDDVECKMYFQPEIPIRRVVELALEEKYIAERGFQNLRQIRDSLNEK